MTERKTPRLEYRGDPAAEGIAASRADAAYERSMTRARTALQRIAERLDAHAAKQQADPRNWGYAGDLDRIAELLEEACGEDR